MNAVIVDDTTIALLDAYKQREACAALDGARWNPALKAWLVDATSGNLASIAAVCSLPDELRALLPRVEQRIVEDTGEWVTYDAALYDQSLVVVSDNGEIIDHNRDRAKAPWEHQREAVGTVLDHYRRGYGAALLMEQRTGKARCSIELFARLAKMDLVRRVLVVSLSTPCGDYADQVTEYLDGTVSPVLLFGSAKKRRDLLADISGPLQVAIINYESSWRLGKELRAWGPDMVIADEMHKIKSPPKRTKTAPEFLRDLAHDVPYRLGMTGTATPKNPLDIVGEYGFVEPRAFPGGYYATKATYAVETQLGDKTYTDRSGSERPVKIIAGYRRLDELQAKMQSIAFIKRLDECVDMPTAAHIKVPVHLGAKAKAAYRDLTKDSVIAWDTGETSVTNVLSRKMRQQQITSGIVPRDDGVLEICGTEKLDALEDLVSGLIEAQKKVVVYSRFSHEVEGALKMFSKLGVDASEVSGRVPVGSKRDEQIERFKRDPSVLGFVGQIQAGGTGIDLSVSAVEVFVSKTHNFVDYDQARSRIVSIKQGKVDRKLTYYHLVVPGTVDDEIEESREMKCDLSLIMLNRNGNPFETKRDIASLVVDRGRWAL